MAFSRYFVVLLPAVVPVLAVQIGALEFILWPAGDAGAGAGGQLVGIGFAELDTGVGGVQEQDQFV